HLLDVALELLDLAAELRERLVGPLELCRRSALHGRELVDELAVFLLLMASDRGPARAEDLPDRDAHDDRDECDPGDHDRRNGPVDVAGGCEIRHRFSSFSLVVPESDSSPNERAASTTSSGVRWTENGVTSKNFIAFPSSESSSRPVTRPAASRRWRCMWTSGRLSPTSRASWLTCTLPLARVARIFSRCGFERAASMRVSSGPVCGALLSVASDTCKMILTHGPSHLSSRRRPDEFVPEDPSIWRCL